MANKIRPEEQESAMLEIYVLKLCVVSFEGTLPCRVENALISKKLVPFCQKLLPWGRSLPRGPWNCPIRAQCVADQTWASTARTAPPQSSPTAFFSPNPTEIHFLPPSPATPPNKKKRERKNNRCHFQIARK